jgi:hypothetical protein
MRLPAYMSTVEDRVKRGRRPRLTGEGDCEYRGIVIPVFSYFLILIS